MCQIRSRENNIIVFNYIDTISLSLNLPPPYLQCILLDNLVLGYQYHRVCINLSDSLLLLYHALLPV